MDKRCNHCGYINPIDANLLAQIQGYEPKAAVDITPEPIEGDKPPIKILAAYPNDETSLEVGFM